MRSVRSKWVGESERNLDRVFAITEAMTPCVFFIDEIDQALGQRGEGGDAGTSQRMLKRMMEFLAMEEHRGRVLFIAATNAFGGAPGTTRFPERRRWNMPLCLAFILWAWNAPLVSRHPPTAKA